MNQITRLLSVLSIVTILLITAVSPTYAQEDEGVGLMTEFLFHVHFDIGTTQIIGPREIYPGVGGNFEGPVLSGEVIGPGGDWGYTTPDGTFWLDGRSTFMTNEGELIYVHFTGVRYITPEQGAIMAAGEFVDPTDLYWRIVVYFETASEELAWMNYTIGLGAGTGFGFSAEGVLEWVEFDIYALR